MGKENPFGFEKAEDSTGFLLWQTHNLWQREIRKSLQEYNLTHTQFVVMASTYYLGMHHQEVTQIDVSKESNIDVMLTSNVMRALEKRGLLRRAEHSSDTRAKIVMLTDEGYSILKKAVKKVEHFDAIFFSSLKNKIKFNQELIHLLNRK